METAEGLGMPVLWLFKEGRPEIFYPLIDYFHDRRGRKLNWKRRAARSLGLFFDFSGSFTFDERQSMRNRHSATLSAFIHALQQGTIPADGVDESRLFWPPMSTNMVTETARHLDYFVDYTKNLLKDLTEDHPLKALQKAFHGSPTDSSTTVRFLITAKRLSSRSFLKHLKEDAIGASEQERRSRQSLGLEKKSIGYQTMKTMPLQLVTDLLSFGFITNPNASDLFEREDITAKMVFILLIGGGLRLSEPLHMWFNDVTFPTLKGEGRCLPILRHPSQALTYIECENCTRMQYLKQRGLYPRNIAQGKSMFAGWKELSTDQNTKSTEVYFIHENLEHLFATYYNYYLNIRRELIGKRIATGKSDHPFLFVSNGEDRNSGESYIGAPYSEGAFRGAFERALVRVETKSGQPIARGKMFGTTPHALRHAYAMILVKCGAPQKAIQRALHHRSILSQDVYTQPEWGEVNAALSAARTGKPHFLLNVKHRNIDPYDETQELAQKWHF